MLTANGLRFRHGPTERPPPATGKLGSGRFECQDLLRNRFWELDEHELALVIQIILTTFIYDSNQAAPRRSRVWYDPIDLPQDERSPVISVIHAKGKRLCWLLHTSSKWHLILRSLLPIPCASYQCNSTLRRAPFGSRTVAVP